MRDGFGVRELAPPAPAPLAAAAKDAAVKTEIWESDPFTPQKGKLLASIESEYRFEKGDEVYFDDTPSRLKVRVIDVRLHVKGDGAVHREILALKL
jgi:hypothetical protein